MADCFSMPNMEYMVIAGYIEKQETDDAENDR